MRLTVGVEAYRSTASDMGIARIGTRSDWGDSVDSERKILHSVNRVHPIHPYVNLNTIAIDYKKTYNVGPVIIEFRQY